MIQGLIRAVYPARCISCGALTEDEFGLCGACWRDTGFIGGTVCDLCGTPLPGESRQEAVHCDDCLRIARPWARGRAVFLYAGTGRRLVLQFKHGDRTDLAPALARWLARAAAPMAEAGTILVPVPLHWSRLLARRYNQAALLARTAAGLMGLPCCPDALVRRRRTALLEGKGRDARFAAVDGTIMAHPARRAGIAGRPVLLVDDVMTSGATLAAATEALQAAGAGQVCTIVLARVAKDA
jgi:predicted amidophosphoribosyltransferase